MARVERRERVHCRVCGRRVRSRVGDVCSRLRCHETDLARSKAWPGWADKVPQI